MIEQILIFEDPNWMDMEPLSLTRPVFLVHCGSRSLLANIMAQLGDGKYFASVRPAMAPVLRDKHPQITVDRLPKGSFLAVNGSWLLDTADAATLDKLKPDHALWIKDSLAAAHVRNAGAGNLKHDTHFLAFLERLPARRISGTLLRYPWEVVHSNSAQLKRDFHRPDTPAVPPPGAVFYKPALIRIGRNVRIDSGVVLDAGQGPITIEDDVTIMPQAVILGPAHIGRGSLVKIGARLYPGVSIGEVCKVGCEMANSIMHSYSNAQHDGFLGNSCIGEWVNFGAGTITSDLKNTYGPIRVPTHRGLIDTHLNHVGSMVGDQSKIGIAGLLNSGSIIGAHCNLFGSGFHPRHVPSFSWGGQAGFSEYRFDKALLTARRMMKRRHCHMPDYQIELYRHLFEATRTFRTEFLATAANR